MKQSIIAGANFTWYQYSAYPFSFAHSWGETANRWALSQIIAAGGTLRNFKIILSAAPGAGKSWTMTVYKNGIATTMSVVITGAATTGEDVTHEIAVTAGDDFYIYGTPAGTPTACRGQWSFEFEGSADGQSLVLGSVTTESANTYQTISSGYRNGAPVEARARQVIPTAGVLKNWYIKLDGSPGGGNKEFKYELRVNGATQALQVRIIGDATSASDTVNSVTVAAGDIVDILYTDVNSPTMTRVGASGMVFEPSNNGECMYLGNDSNGPINSAVRATWLSSAYLSQTWHLPNAGREQRSGAQALYNFYVELLNAPGAGKAWTFKVLINGVASGIEVTISGTDKTGHDTTHQATVVDGDRLAFATYPSLSPTTGHMGWGVAGYVLVAGAKCYGLHPGARAEMLS